MIRMNLFRILRNQICGHNALPSFRRYYNFIEESLLAALVHHFTSLLCFSWWWVLLLCCFVSARHLPRAPFEPEVCVFPLCAVFFLSFLMSANIFLSSLLPCLFRSFDYDLDIHCFMLCLFFVGTTLSPWFRLPLQLV